jgi:hypothetical protein
LLREVAKIAVFAKGDLMQPVIKSVPVKGIGLDPENVRKHSYKNLEAIKSSLRKFGQVKPIVLHQNVVVAGNGTLMAAQELGWSAIDVVELPDDWSKDKVKAFAIADNRTAELANWDTEMLNIQLEELKEFGYHLEDVGFNEQDVANMLRLNELKNGEEIDPFAEWKGMPEFDSEDKVAAFRVAISFVTEQDANDFFELIDRPKKSVLWWPAEDGHIGSTVKMQYINDEE